MSIIRTPPYRFRLVSKIAKTYGMRGFTEKTARVVSDFIEVKHNNTLFKTEVNHIIPSVSHMMKNIIIQSSKKDARFKVKHLQLIGSMYEETKILAPNEFDFFAVFDYDIISDRRISLKSGCRPGFTKIRVNEISKQWSDCCQGFYLSPHKCMRIFESLLPSQLENISPIITPSGTLYGWKRRKRTFDLVWKKDDGCNMDIAVDIMPAFPVIYRDLQKTLREECTDTRMDELGPTQACYLIPRSCEHHYEGKCWHNSFAHAESEMIRKMDSGKKKCHRVLKLLFTSDQMGKSEYLTSYALKSAIMYKSKIDFDHELQFILYIFIHFAKCFDQTCMPTYFLTKTNVWKNILEHRTHNIWGSHFLCDILVRRQLVENIGKSELRRRYPAWNSAIVLEFWRRMMILLIVVFSTVESSENIEQVFELITNTHSRSNFYYLDQLRNKKLNWLLAAPQYDVLNIRANYRRVISSLDIPIYTELTNELQRNKLLDMKALNSLIRKYKYTFKAGNDRFVNLEVRRDSNVYIPHRTSCKSETLSRQQYTVRYRSAKHR